MEYGLELKTGSKQKEDSKPEMEKIQSPRASQDLKFDDQRKVLKKGKRQVEYTFGKPFINRHYELRRGAGDEPMVQLKSSGTKQKQFSGSNTNKGDELVKHMSNLPGYLQQVERGEKPPNNALNFGVLDWERLEKWKYTEKRLQTKSNMDTSSSMARGATTIPSTSHSTSLAPQRKQPASHSCRLNKSYSKQSREKLIHVQDFETSQRSTLNEQRNVLKDMSLRRNYSGINLDRGKRRESDQTTTSEKESSLSDWRNPGSPLSLHDRMSSQGGENMKKADEEINLGFQDYSSGHQSIGLLLPIQSPKNSWSNSSQLSKSRTSFDGTLTESNMKKFPDCFSTEYNRSLDVYSEIPQSCALPVSSATNNESDIELQSDASVNSQCPNEIPIAPSKGKCEEDVAELPVAKGRFSFSISRMTRSLSSKEGSVTPRSSSTSSTLKSGTVRFEASAGLDDFNKNKATTSGRAKSSPLRRLLNPLLKPKETNSTETLQPSKRNLNSVGFKSMKTTDMLQKKVEGERVQALLQLKIKNGLPLFKLVVDSSSDILAAAVKKAPASEKDNNSLTFAFYSVREIKKKSGGWINQVSKGKTSGFGYNIVSQMKVCSPYLSDLIGQNTNGQDVVRESVLYGVDLGQENKETPEFMPNRELAAIVLKNPTEENYTQKGFIESSENGKSERTIVILPDGIHGLPIKGLPSPLITRWRGKCDCGGWDLGCKLRILTNGDHSNKNLKPSISCSATDRLDLFVQVLFFIFILPWPLFLFQQAFLKSPCDCTSFPWERL